MTAPKLAPLQPAAPSPHHIPTLDGLRGLAILLVIFHHFLLIYPAATPFIRIINCFSSSAWVGVDLFFVLSGFLITGILADARNHPRYFRTFYARRALRIFPLYYAYLLLYAAIVWLRHTPTPPHETPIVALYGTNLLIALHQNFLTPWITHFWSLAIEEHFYLLWPIIVLVLPPKKLLHACRLLILLALFSRCLILCFAHNPFAAYVLTPCRVDGLAIGAYLALSLRQPHALQQLLPLARYIGLISFSLLALAFAQNNGLDWANPFTQTLGLSLLALLFGSLLLTTLAADPHSLQHRFFSSPLLRFFGKYSYALYLFHWPIHHALLQWETSPTAQSLFAPLSPGLLQWLDALLGISLSLAAACLSWHLFEKHFLRLKKYFATPLPQLPRALPHPAPSPPQHPLNSPEIYL